MDKKKDKKLRINRREFFSKKINLVIRIGMKKVEVTNYSNTGLDQNNVNQMSSNDTNNNESTNNNSIMKVKKDLPSLAMSVKNLFNKSSSSSSSSSNSGDKNNNPVVTSPPTTNQYTKVSVEGLAPFQNLNLNDTQKPQGLLQNKGNNTGMNNQTDPSRR
jgi:hypothetical protein